MGTFFGDPMGNQVDPNYLNWGYPTNPNDPNGLFYDPSMMGGYLGGQLPDSGVGTGNTPAGYGPLPYDPSPISSTLNPPTADPNNPYNTGTSTTYPGGQNPTYGASGDPTFSTSPTDPMPPSPTIGQPPTYSPSPIPPFPTGIGTGIPSQAPYPNTGGGYSTTFPTRPQAPSSGGQQQSGGGAGFVAAPRPQPPQQSSAPRPQPPSVSLSYDAPPISSGLPSSQSGQFNPIGIQTGGLPGPGGTGGQRSQSDSLLNQILYRALNPRQRANQDQPIGPSGPSYDVDSSGF